MSTEFLMNGEPFALRHSMGMASGKPMMMMTVEITAIEFRALPKWQCVTVHDTGMTIDEWLRDNAMCVFSFSRA